MKEHQILRIPIKYSWIFNSMTDEDCGKLLKSIFNNDRDDLFWLNKVYFDVIMTDINNLENIISIWRNGWEKWWRPKKEISQELSEDFKELLKDEDTTITSHLFKNLTKLWYIPNNKETTESFKKWFMNLEINPNSCKEITNNFFDYWSNQKIVWQKDWKKIYKDNAIRNWYG